MASKKKVVKAFAVTNLGGENLAWGLEGQLNKLPIFLRKKRAAREKKNLDDTTPFIKLAKFQRFVVPCTITYLTPQKRKK